MIMETLDPRQKQEWKSGIDDRWLRTGCHDMWDAVFIAFRDYRDAPPTVQKEMIMERTKIQCPSLQEWVSRLYQKLVEEKSVNPDDHDDKTLFFKLLPLRLLSSEILPYIERYMEENPKCSLEDIKHEIEDKCRLLAEYRQQKKGYDVQGLKERVQQYLLGVYKKIQHIPYDEIQTAMGHVGYDLIIISPHEKVLFDTKTEKNGDDYQDVVIILSHPDGSFDSIGRQTYTKDGHQKISRLFHYDDEAVDILRRHE